MIRPPGWDGVAFTDRADGDLRGDATARERIARALDISPRWATVHQVHGNVVRRVSQAGDAGEADALWTAAPGLPLAVFTADCFGVVLGASDAVGVAHAGWRGADAGVVGRLADDMRGSGHAPARAAIGPGIGPCCFEVGPEVAGRFETSHCARTTWGSVSVDLPDVIASQLGGLELWSSGSCTLHEEGWLSHRQDATPARMAAIGWLP